MAVNKTKQFKQKQKTKKKNKNPTDPLNQLKKIPFHKLKTLY